MRVNIATNTRRTMAKGDAMFEPEFSFGVVVELVGLGEEVAVVFVPVDDIIISRSNWRRARED